MINHKLGQLYRYYKARVHLGIVTGGLVSERDYVLSKPRVVFIGKEISMRRTGWSISQQMRQCAVEWLKGRGLWDSTYGLVGIWAYGVSQGFPTWREVDHCKKLCAAYGLLAIGITNLNLGPGHPVSDSVAIGRAALSPGRRQLLARELTVMRPDLVLCGRTFWEVVEALGLDSDQARPVIRGREFYYTTISLDGHMTVLLDLNHPSRWGHRESYEQVRDLVTRLREMGILN